MIRGAFAAALMLALVGCSSTPTDGSRAQVVFSGNDTQFEFRLRRVIEDLLIDFDRDPSHEAAIFDAALDLADYYHAEGYPDATVQYRIERQPRLRVVFAIQEGPLVVVERLYIEGEESIDEDELKALWRRERSGLLATGKPYFVWDELLALRFAFVDYYQARGWLDVVVDGPSVAREPGATRAEVAYNISEGKRYRVAGIEFDPELLLTASELGVKPMIGAPFDRLSVQELPARTRSHLGRRGHPQPRVQMDMDIDREAETVVLRLHGVAGPRARITGYRIEGRDRTRKRVFIQQFEFETGTLFDSSKIEATVKGLYTTGLFKQVEIVPELAAKDAVNGEVVDAELVIRVVETDPRAVSFLLGYGSYETLRGGMFYTDRSFLGLGQRLQIGIRGSLKSWGVSGSWTEPHLAGSDTQLTIGASVNEREEPAFIDFSRSIDVAVARRLGDLVRGRVGYALQNRDGRALDNTALQSIAENFEISTIFGELTIDERENPLYPSNGHRESVKLEHATDLLGGSVNFDRLTAEAACFVNLGNRWVFGLAARGGVARPHDATGIPLQERFFNGGESSVRSFQEAELGPRSATGTPLGGEFFTTFNAELRFPLYGALQGAVFGDAGNVGLDYSSFGLSQLRYGVGGGLRVALPIGPVRFDGAVNPDRRPGESTYVLHLSVGLPF